MRYIRATRIITDYIDVKTRADIYEEEWHYSDVYIDNAKLHLRAEEDIIVLDPITKKLQMLKGADIEHRSEDNVDRAVQYANAAGWALYTKDSTGAWKERISVSGGVDIAEVKIKNSTQKIVPPSGGDAIVVRDSTDSEDRVKITEDGMMYFEKLETGIYYKDADGVYRNALRFYSSYGGLIVVGNTAKPLELQSSSLVFRASSLVQSKFAANPLPIRTYSASDKAITIQSHDGSAYRTSLKFIGGQMEVYSWDGSAEQLVAKTNAGYLEIARGKLTGDLDVEANLKIGVNNDVYLLNVVHIGRLGGGAVWFAGSAFAPVDDNTKDLGYADYRWRKIYFGSSLVGKSDTATDTETLKPSPPLELIASVWDSANAVAKDQKFKIYHEPTDLDKGKLAIDFINTGGTATRIFELSESGGLKIPATLDTNSLAIGGTTVIDSSRNLVGVNAIAQNLNPDADATRDLGSSTLRWNNLYCVTANVGDIVLKNGWKITEYGNKLLFVNPEGIPVLCLCPDGTLVKVECRKAN